MENLIKTIIHYLYLSYKCHINIVTEYVSIICNKICYIFTVNMFMFTIQFMLTIKFMLYNIYSKHTVNIYITLNI